MAHFTPIAKPKGFDELKYYSSIFNTVEINSTFYRPASVAMTKNWAAKTPADFFFAIKLWQKFTHPKKLGGKEVGGEWENITPEDIDKVRASLEPLADARKLGALLLQYPAGFHCIPENVESVERTLRAFADYPKVIELRHKSWSENRADNNALLRENRTSEVFIDEPKFSTSIRQDFKPTGEIFYFRAHGRNAKAWWSHKESWERYDYLYTRPEIKKIAAKVKEGASTPGVKKSFAVFNNHARANSAANAIMLSQELGERLRAMPSEAMVARFPDLVQAKTRFRGRGRDKKSQSRARNRAGCHQSAFEI